MNSRPECVPCYLKQGLATLNAINYPEKDKYDLLLKLAREFRDLDPIRSPAENSSIVLLHLNKFLENDDPFKVKKRESNQHAWKFYDRVEREIKAAVDPLKAAIHFAVAGNIVDMGIHPNFDLGKTVAGALEKAFAIDHYDIFKERLKNAESVLILGDNSGEIIFDRLLVKELAQMGKKVVYAVKGGPILNDATREDALAARMNELAEVIDTGVNFLGSILSRTSTEFRARFAQAPLVLSKGQANYESLEGSEEAGDKTFFLLRAKCPVVAKNLGVEFGDTVFMQNSLK